MVLPPDEPNEEERREELPGDTQTPFSPAPSSRDDDTGQPAQLDDTHPSTDTNIEPEELYDEGLAGAAEAEDPSPRDDVVGYDPDKDSRKDH
jgi:hypothetical protein